MVMNQALKGKTYAGGDAVVVGATSAAAYADATDADLAAYRGDNAVAPPMYGVAYAFAALGAPLFDPLLHVEMMRLVHGEQDMQFTHVVKAGDSITSHSQIAAIEHKASGEVLDVAITSQNQHGAVVLRANSRLFIRAPRQRDASERKDADSDVDAFAAAPHAWSDTQVVSADQSTRYAEASGDHNPIHLDIDVAKLAGLPAIILHGLCTMAFVHNACVRQLDGDPSRLTRLAVRFNRPVLMGDVLRIEARGPVTVDGERAWRIEVKNQADVVVLKNGVARWR